MAAPVWTIDGVGPLYPGATSPSASTYPAGAGALTITSSPYFLTSQQLPLPDLDAQYGSSVTTEGDRLQTQRYRNRKVTLQLRVIGSSAANLQTAVNNLQAKVGKINRDAVIGGTGYGGTLEHTTVNGTKIVFDVCSATMSTELGRAYVIRNGTDVTLDFDCAPFARGAEVDLGDNVETTLPYLAFTSTAVTGDVPALGRLVVDNDDATYDQAWAIYGVRCNNYSADASAGLFYQCESLTAQAAGASSSTAASGYSGTGSVLANKVVNYWQSAVSTGALSHSGRYRVFVRAQVPRTNLATVSTAFEWGLGDMRETTRNTPVALNHDPHGDAWRLLDLGVVNISATASRWEGRIVTKGSYSGTQSIYYDWLMLVPVDEASGEATAQISTASPTLFMARDDFSSGTYSGGLAGDTLPAGGTWGTTGSPYETDDFSVTGGAAVRTIGSDGADERYGRVMYPSDTFNMTTTAVQADLRGTNVNGVVNGVVARVVDKDTMLIAGYAWDDYTVRVILFKNGTRYYVCGATIGSKSVLSVRLRLVVDKYGQVFVYAATSGNTTVDTDATMNLIASGSNPHLAAGQTLAAGYAGIWAYHPGASASNSTSIDNFYTWIPQNDAAIFASRSLTVKHDSILRLDSAGAYSQPVSAFAGDYLTIPQAGKEGRTVQVIVKASRGVPGLGMDGGIDDISARLIITPRFLQLPS